MNHRSGSLREAGGEIFCTLADRVRRWTRRTMPYYTDLVIGGGYHPDLSAVPVDAIPSPLPPPPTSHTRLARQHRVRRSGQLPSGHTGRCHLEVFAAIRAMVDGRTVDIRPGFVRASRVPFQPHALAGAGAYASLEEGKILPLGHRRVLDDHHRPPDRRRIRHVREKFHCYTYISDRPPRALSTVFGTYLHRSYLPIAIQRCQLLFRATVSFIALNQINERVTLFDEDFSLTSR